MQEAKDYIWSGFILLYMLVFIVFTIGIVTVVGLVVNYWLSRLSNYLDTLERKSRDAK